MFWITVLITGWLSYLLVGILYCCLTYWLTDLFYLLTGWHILLLYLTYWLIYFACVSFLMPDIFCFSVLHTGWHILLLCLTYWLTNLVLFFIGWYFASLSYIRVDIVCFSALYRPLETKQPIVFVGCFCFFVFLFFVLLLCQFVSKRITVCFKSWALLVAAMLVCSLPKKSRKKLARDVLDTFATRASFAHDVLDTGIKRQHSRSCFRDF